MLLSGILLFAICHRNNIFSALDKGYIFPGENTLQQWNDTIRYKNLVFIADSCTGLTVRDHNGVILSGDDSVRPEAIHLKPGQVLGTDTVDLLFCKTDEPDKIPCFRILDDGTLKVVEI